MLSNSAYFFVVCGFFFKLTFLKKSFWNTIRVSNSLDPDQILLCWGLTTPQPLWVILCHLPEKGRKETEEIVEEMKERDREERGTGMKVKKQKK